MDTRDLIGNRTPPALAADIPRMVSDGDVALAEALARGLDATSVIVEFGPWLGGFSSVLAPYGQLHVVDSFVWTKDHAKKVPGLLEPGASFRPVFEENLAGLDLRAEIHETAFADFAWKGPPIALCVIDGPKTDRALWECLRAVLPHLADDGRVLLKNALALHVGDLGRCVEWLVDCEVVSLPPQTVPAVSNMVVLGPGTAGGELALEDVSPPEIFSLERPLWERVDMDADHPWRLSGLARAAERGDFRDAYICLSAMAPERGLKRAWGKIEERLLKRRVDPEQLSHLTEVIGIHHAAVPKDLPEPFHMNASRALRGYWLNNANNPNRGADFHPDMLLQALDFGYVSYPSKVREFVTGKDVLDVGCGPGLHGIGYLAAGARSYYGMDPIVRVDRDRVKHMGAKTRMKFGWTPAEMAERIGAWHIDGRTVEELGDEPAFDIATLHNVTEHLPDLETAFENIARLLRPRGGQILYNHHNYNSWNGHHCSPKSVADIDLSDPAQRELIDWGHVRYRPAPEHYIARGLNRISLDEIVALTERYFEIEICEEIPSGPSMGGDRLTDAIRARYPELTDRDFLTQNLFCVARVRS